MARSPFAAPGAGLGIGWIAVTAGIVLGSCAARDGAASPPPAGWRPESTTTTPPAATATTTTADGRRFVFGDRFELTLPERWEGEALEDFATITTGGRCVERFGGADCEGFTIAGPTAIEFATAAGPYTPDSDYGWHSGLDEPACGSDPQPELVTASALEVKTRRPVGELDAEYREWEVTCDDPAGSYRERHWYLPEESLLIATHTLGHQLDRVLADARFVGPSPSAPAPPPVDELETGLSCGELRRRGYLTSEVFAYWRDQPSPDGLDADRDGVPCAAEFADMAELLDGDVGCTDPELDSERFLRALLTPELAAAPNPALVPGADAAVFALAQDLVERCGGPYAVDEVASRLDLDGLTATMVDAAIRAASAG